MAGVNGCFIKLESEDQFRPSLRKGGRADSNVKHFFQLNNLLKVQLFVCFLSVHNPNLNHRVTVSSPKLTHIIILKLGSVCLQLLTHR